MLLIIKRYKKHLILTLIGLLIFIPILLSLVWLNDYLDLFPSGKFTKQYKDRLMKEPTVFLDRNNNQLGSIGGSSEFQIHLVSLSRHDLTTLSKILFAKEDRKISKFDGIQSTGIFGTVEAMMEVISWKGKLRAVYQTFSGSTQGASGLLEQIVGNLYAHDDQNPWFQSGFFSRIERKIVKTINAIRLAHLYPDAAHVVEDYVNLTYTAGMYHGINAFMLKRFDQPIDKILVPINLEKTYLNDQQIDIINMLAYYVGQLTGPANYDPGVAKNPIEEFRIQKRAEFKKNLVLTQMRDLGMIKEQVYLQAMDRKLPFKTGDIAPIAYDPNVEILRREAIDIYGNNLGGVIRTTLIKEIQDLVNYELTKHRTILSIKATGAYLPSKDPLLRSARPDLYGIYRVKVISRSGDRVTVDLGVRIGHRQLQIPAKIRPKYLTYFSPGKYISVGIDGFDEKGLPNLSLVQSESFIKGAVLLKDLTNGDVIAFGGGGYLNATISPGSAFKPFLLKLAMDYGWQLEDRLNNGCYLKYRLFSSPFYSPKNYGRCDESREDFERYPDVKTVLKKSINKPVVYLLSHLTDQLPDSEYRSMVDRVVRAYDKEKLQPGDFSYLVRETGIDYFLTTDDGNHQFIGRISFANLRDKLIFDRLKREKYLRLNESNLHLLAAEVLDHGYEEFIRWHSALQEVRDQFSKLESGLDAYDQSDRKKDSFGAVAELDHFSYDNDGNLHYDPYSPDKITFINWELVREFLKKHSVSEVLLGKFTYSDHKRFDDWINEYSQMPDQTFFREMMIYHPQIRGLVNVELFKAYLADLTGTEKKDILGDFSLPLGTHRVSLLELSEMYSQILTTDPDNPLIRNNKSYFFDQNQVGARNADQEKRTDSFQLIEDNDLFAALKAARQEKGGTSFHLKSPAIIAGKTGTDPKYKTYVAIVKLNGIPYLATAYFGVDLNKHEPLVKSWTGGWTAAVYIDRIISDIEKRHLQLLPKYQDYNIEFDPNFEYDATSNDLPQDENDAVSSNPEPEKEPRVIWQPDGSYHLEYDDEPKSDASSEIESEPTVEMNYSEEEIDQLIQQEQMDQQKQQ